MIFIIRVYVRVAQSVEYVTAERTLFYLDGIAGSIPTVYFYFYFFPCFLFN